MARESRVRRVELRVRAAGAEEGRELVRAAETGFLPAVLAVCDEAVHRRVGADALVFVRHLDVRWSLERDRLGDAAALAALGEELAEVVLTRLERLPTAERLRPRGERDMVWFAGEAHRRAAFLADRAEGRSPAWFQRELAEEADVWSSACARGPELLHELLEWLVEMRAADVVLAALSPAQREQAWRTLPADAWPEGAPRAPARVPRREGEAAGEAGAPRPARVPGAADALTEGVAPPDAGPSSPPAEKAGAQTLAAPRAAAVPAPGSADDVAPAALAGAPAGPLSAAVAPEPGASAPAASASAPSSAPASVAAAPTGAEALPSVDDGVRTRFGGLFYLAGRVQELDLAARLYEAGALERDFLFHVAHALLGPDADDDPAAWLFAGCPAPSPPPLQKLQRWQIDEVWQATSAALAGELARAGAALAPAALAARVDELAAGVAPPRASGPVDALSAHLVRRAAAAVRLVFEARLGEPLEPSLLAVDAVVHRRAEELCVCLPMAAVDLRLRRAGLDFDPGYLPWLERTLRLEYVPDPYAGEIA